MKTIYSALIILALLSPGVSFGADQCRPVNAQELTIAEIQDYEQIAHCNTVRVDAEPEEYSVFVVVGKVVLLATYLAINVASMRP